MVGILPFVEEEITRVSNLRMLSIAMQTRYPVGIVDCRRNDTVRQ
jgi:hypothetical protein